MNHDIISKRFFRTCRFGIFETFFSWSPDLSHKLKMWANETSGWIPSHKQRPALDFLLQWLILRLCSVTFECASTVSFMWSGFLNVLSSQRSCDKNVNLPPRRAPVVSGINIFTVCSKTTEPKVRTETEKSRNVSWSGQRRRRSGSGRTSLAWASAILRLFSSRIFSSSSRLDFSSS